MSSNANEKKGPGNLKQDLMGVYDGCGRDKHKNISISGKHDHISPYCECGHKKQEQRLFFSFVVLLLTGIRGGGVDEVGVGQVKCVR